MNPLCGFQSLWGIQTRSEVEIEKGFNAKGWVIQRFPKCLFALQESLDGWSMKLANSREVPPPLCLQCRAGTKAHTKASKVVRGCGHIFACVWGPEGGGEDSNTNFSVHSFLVQGQCREITKGCFLWTWSAIWEMSTISNSTTILLQIVPVLKVPFYYLVPKWLYETAMGKHF